MSTIQTIAKDQKLSCPPWLLPNIHYETTMGSSAYGVANNLSDIDVYGFCIPPKHMVFPHLAGNIIGFGRQHKAFKVWQQHHIDYKEENYDLTIFSIVRFFHLCMDNNPNMVDCLFSPVHCIRHITTIGTLVRDNRHLFLHKGAYHRFKGYAYSQLNKMRTRTPKGERAKTIEKYGFDIKYGYHLVRLLLECQQILSTENLVLDRDKELLKSMRAGEWSMDKIVLFFEKEEKHLDELYRTSNLPHKPDESKIKDLLLQCLEMHYGSVDDCIIREDQYVKALSQIKEIIEKVRM